VVCARVVESRTTTGTCTLLFESSSPDAESGLGEAQEDQAEYRLGILRRTEARIRAELVCRVPEMPFESVGSRVFLRWSDPAHSRSTSRSDHILVRALLKGPFANCDEETDDYELS
jgi:hypothetical protein